MFSSEDDRESFVRWAGQRQLSLVRTATLITGDRHRADDLVQEALTKVALRWRQLRDGNPDAYARRIIARDHVSWWRKTRREHPAAQQPDAPARTADPDRRLLLDDALAALTARQRAVVVLRYYDDLTERDTAEALGVSVGTVKSQTHVALRRMRETSPHLADLLTEESR